MHGYTELRLKLIKSNFGIINFFSLLSVSKSIRRNNILTLTSEGLQACLKYIRHEVIYILTFEENN